MTYKVLGLVLGLLVGAGCGEEAAKEPTPFERCSETCDGCCEVGSGACLFGNDDGYCGASGLRCRDCRSTGGVCGPVQEPTSHFPFPTRNCEWR